MAMGRIFFPAEESNSKPLHSALQSGDPGRETCIVSKPAIDHAALVIVIVRILGPAAQFGAQKQIPDARLFERAAELPVKLWRKAGIGRRTQRIDNHIDRVWPISPAR